jgi:hypothetical protein
MAKARDLGRLRGIAEVEGQPSIAQGNAFDPDLRACVELQA